ncbi:phosphate:acyl-[acyl carrier protein] acyltransferase [Andreprevotia lacus DSM 23236]|jgi:glycerol-3-phosphate acyltransferase PlsX|uniref:Phosphate acyltransferase n=1 Tax=Andreprevotia lacus DSM 23236 TaxID=1121001 RepID=A0A1W1XZB2_9NEIS|nr:phosphate acyltransferase PlsX [Andreprevotia lacus]SMC29214.1 phosphate:acyl-[acyl carrier protein] acyltransferase [Andreprevotia lacus DSM 23236]
MDITVAVDAMGGDHGAHITVPAVLRFLDRHPEVNVVLVGLPDAIESELRARKASVGPRLRIHPASEIVTMDEAPQSALKNKKDSSMRVAINLVKSGEANACVSAGNTGALMATARFVLKTIEGVERPAIAKMMPTASGGETCVLDLGANVDCTPEQLTQFGIMGASLVAAVHQKDRPTVGLLNIGSEEIKGNESVKAAAEMLRASKLNFHGNVEGNELFTGKVDVIVADGFTGNVALKTTEGLAKMLAEFLREEFTRTWWTRFLAVLAWPVLSHFKKRVDPRRYNGASLLGLKGIVVKSHGGADQMAFYWALKQAVTEAQSGVIQRITEQVREQLADLAATPVPAAQ